MVELRRDHARFLASLRRVVSVRCLLRQTPSFVVGCWAVAEAVGKACQEVHVRVRHASTATTAQDANEPARLKLQDSIAYVVSASDARHHTEPFYTPSKKTIGPPVLVFVLVP